jgi:hypothetical protein
MLLRVVCNDETTLEKSGDRHGARIFLELRSVIDAGRFSGSAATLALM